MEDKFKIYVNKSKKEDHVVYEDKFPEGTTLEDLQEKHLLWLHRNSEPGTLFPMHSHEIERRKETNQ